MATVAIAGVIFAADQPPMLTATGPELVGPLHLFAIGLKAHDGRRVNLCLNREEAANVADWLRDALQGEWA